MLSLSFAFSGDGGECLLSSMERSLSPFIYDTTYPAKRVSIRCPLPHEIPRAHTQRRHVLTRAQVETVQLEIQVVSIALQSPRWAVQIPNLPVIKIPHILL